MLYVTNYTENIINKNHVNMAIPRQTAISEGDKQRALNKKIMK